MTETWTIEKYNKFLNKEKKGRNRYGNRKKEDKPNEDGHVFDSDSELYRYRDLKLLQRKGEVRDLKVQPRTILRKRSVNSHGQKISQWAYKADYSYFDSKGILYWEDVKSLRIAKDGKKYGTATERGYMLSKNEFMRQNPEIVFVETIY